MLCIKNMNEEADKIEIIEMERKQPDNIWKSCCGLELDKNAVQYFTTIGIICAIMSFAIYKLCIDESGANQTAYMGLLTLLLGILSPSPMFKNK